MKQHLLLSLCVFLGTAQECNDAVYQAAAACMDPLAQKIATEISVVGGNPEPSKVCPVLKDLMNCVPAACADKLKDKTAYYQKMITSWCSTTHGGDGTDCEKKCQADMATCLRAAGTDQTKQMACVKPMMVCSLKCNMPWASDADLAKAGDCSAGCMSGPEAEREQCDRKCVASLTPACMKGPDGFSPQDSPIFKCLAERQVPFNGTDPDFQNCDQLAIGKECAASTCGGSIPPMLVGSIKEEAEKLKCGAATPTAKPTEIIRTGSPTVVGGSGSPTSAFTLSPTRKGVGPAPTNKPSVAPTNKPSVAPTNKPTAAGQEDASGAPSLLPAVAVALGAVVVLV